jgi:hypothetical protein
MKRSIYTILALAFFMCFFRNQGHAEGNGDATKRIVLEYKCELPDGLKHYIRLWEKNDILPPLRRKDAWEIYRGSYQDGWFWVVHGYIEHNGRFAESPPIMQEWGIMTRCREIGIHEATAAIEKLELVHGSDAVVAALKRQYPKWLDTLFPLPAEVIPNAGALGIKELSNHAPAPALAVTPAAGAPVAPPSMVVASGAVLCLHVGATHDETMSVLKKVGAVDITENVEMLREGPGEGPLRGFFWLVRDYDIVIGLSETREDKIERISFWKPQTDFDKDKGTVAEIERYARSLKFDTEKKTVEVEVFRETKSGATQPSLSTAASGTPTAGAPVASPSGAADL